MPAFVASRRPRSKMGGARKVGSMRQQLKPKTARQLEAEERRLKRFDSDSEESGSEIPSLPKPQVTAIVEDPVEDSEEEEAQEESEKEEVESSEVVENEEDEDSDVEEEVTESEEDEDSGEEAASDVVENDDDDEEVDSDEEVKAGDESKVKAKSENKEAVSGWADSIAKILGSSKPKNKKEMMLSRARKDYEVSKYANPAGKAVNPQDSLEVIGTKKQKSEKEDSTENQEKKPNVEDAVLSLKVQRKLELKQLKLERAWENLARLNMEKTEPEVERDLLKIATKGVVQLFNAIALQQKTVKSKLRNCRQSEFQKDKILNQTQDIFDSSMSKSKKIGDGSLNDDSIEVKTERNDEDFARTSGKKRRSTDNSSRDSKKKPAWNALQDDFMLDAKLKDWDQNSDSD